MAHELTEEQYKSQVNAVWKATIIMGVITIAEVAFALWWLANMDHGSSKAVLNTGFVLMSLAKAYFIVGEFMHVKYEKRALTLTILGPLFFLIWFIIAFMWEGSEWLALRQFWGM